MRADELLAAALRDEAAPWPAGADGAFAAALFDEARRHGVAALVATAAAVGEWPEELRLAFLKARRDDAAIEALRRDDLRRLLTALHNEGIRSLLMKGAQLAYTHYAQPWLRPRFDTDLLIAPDDRERADATLRAIGYAPSPHVSGTLVVHQFQYRRRNRYGLADVIDLHWKVTNPHVFADVLAFDELNTAARVIPQIGEHASGLSNVHALMLACVHRVAHHQNSDLLIWLYDIHLLATAMTQEERQQFAELARAKRLRSICASGLDHARHRFATYHPEGWRDRLECSGDVEPTAEFLQHDLRRVDILLSDLRTISGWTRKLRLLREHLVPPPAYVRARYGPDMPLVFAYVDRVVTGVGKWFRAAS